MDNICSIFWQKKRPLNNSEKRGQEKGSDVESWNSNLNMKQENS